MPQVIHYENDDFRAWVDGASIQIKAVTGSGDPVDLGTDEVREIVRALARMEEHVDGPANAVFRHQDLSGAVVDDVSLAGANLTNVNLRGASFRDVNMSGVAIDDVNLSGVVITGSRIDGMTIDGFDVHALIDAERKRRG